MTEKTVGVAEYTTRDLILYALGIGCDDTDVRYVYEHDVSFQVFPLFPLSLIFRATIIKQDEKGSFDPCLLDHKVETSSRVLGEMQPFPPFLLKHVLSEIASDFSSNLIHLSQKFQWHDFNPGYLVPPIGQTRKIILESCILQRKEHKKGMIVVNETKFWIDLPKSSPTHQKCLIATSQMTFLILRRMKCDSNSSSMIRTETDDFRPMVKKMISTTSLSPHVMTKTYLIPKTQALLYRLSGDTNTIHVEHGSSVSYNLFSSKQPILHGLCTLGYAVRAVMNHFANTSIRFVSVTCNFINPVFMGDTIRVSMWIQNEKEKKNIIEEDVSIEFKVFRLDSNCNIINGVIDKGTIKLQRILNSKL